MDNTNERVPGKHRFSWHSANAMLPLVKSIAGDVFQLHTEIAETQDRLLAISSTRGSSTRNSDDANAPKPSVYSKEVQAIVDSVSRKQTRMDDCMTELKELNLSFPDYSLPFVNFPAIYDDQDVCLCWKIGEKQINYWHFPGEPCDRRRPVNHSLIPTPVRIELSGSL